MQEMQGLQPVEPPSAHSPKHSAFGIASFALALGAGLISLGFCALAMWAGNRSAHPPSWVNIVALAVCGIGFLLNLTGFAFGIISVIQKNVNKVFGILGLVFNSALLLMYAGFMLLVMVAALATILALY